MDKILNLYTNINNYEINCDTNSPFSLIIKRNEITEPGPIIKQHWHERFMLYYVEKGKSMAHCNSHHILATPGDLIVINSNDVHYVVKLKEL